MSLGHFVVDCLHVSETPRAMLRHVRGRLSPAGRSAKSWPNRKALYRLALEAHKENRSLYRHVMGGHV